MTENIPSRSAVRGRQWLGLPTSGNRGMHLLMLLLLAILGPVADAWAGGGPENVLLVVNTKRPDSMTIANHYAALRQIPGSNIVYLDWNGPTDVITVDYLRQNLLEPLFREIDSRKLSNQIDYIVYSSGFPYAVHFGGDLREKPHVVTGDHGSLNGMTYLHQLVRQRDTSYAFLPTSQRSNYYAGGATRGFRSLYGWNPSGHRDDSQGMRYILSMMLGYTDGRGNSLQEVLAYLQRSATADATYPKGTIYLMRLEAQVRSEVRHDLFPQVATELRQLGVNAEITPGALPFAKQDMMGAVLGLAQFEWARYECKIRPGAIVEHFTSFGGDMRTAGTQSPLTELLRHGAAGASGTVQEPMALLEKFPHPQMHVHYARGATLAEAFYQSVASPYQLLIVGDPLCRPWAKIPQIRVEGLQPNQVISGTLILRPEAVGDVPVRRWRLFVDGRLIDDGQPGTVFQLDTMKMADGHHELRIVGIEDSPIESQGRWIVPVQVNNRGRAIEWAIQPPRGSSQSQFKVLVNAPEAALIYVFHNRRQLAKFAGPSGNISFAASELGGGPAVLTAVAVGKDSADRVFSKPITVQVATP